MKISYNWLKEYIRTDLPAEEIGRILTETGLEVESVVKKEAVAGGLAGVVVGEVLTCEKHPDADKLKITEVSVGGETLQIVCGAPNVAAGQKVVVATVGTTLYPNPDEPFKIKRSKIRGAESAGMLCAEDELGLGESHAGILVLPAETTVGMPAAEYFGLEADYEIEIGLTPNRADAMGHIGVARDLAAYLRYHKNSDVKMELPDVSAFEVADTSRTVDVEVEDAQKCKRYCGLTISGVQIGPSPAWLQKKLRAVGLSPLNNVVDVTNFVMRELGTPLHAFDLDVVGDKVFVKTAKDNAKFTTLDGVERTLNADDLMIANAQENMCIAGVFGGQKSGVSSKTNGIFLESAVFDAVSVRKTARSQGLNTDASFRFERGVDPDLTMYALRRAALLICEVAGGKVTMNPVDYYPEPVIPQQVLFSFERCNRLIGTDIPKADVMRILESLDIRLVSEKDGVATLEVPPYRVDVTREADVVEEVLRIYGFNQVPLPEKLNASLSFSGKQDPEKVQRTISELLVSNGFFETLNNSLTAAAYVGKLGGNVYSESENVEILNPLSQELNVLRQTLLFSGLQVIAHNQNRQHPDLKIFEFGKTYRKAGKGYAENKRLLIALSGKREAENWNASAGQVSYFTLKGVVDLIFRKLGLDGLKKENSLSESILEDGSALSILKFDIGEIGWISGEQKKYFGIKQDVFIADLDWDALLSCLQFAKTKYTELPKTFAVRRDFSLLLDKDTRFSEIESLARAQDKKLLKEVGLFDVYEGKNLEAGKKSYAVSFTFQDPEQTLTDVQVDRIMDKIRRELEQKLQAQLR